MERKLYRRAITGILAVLLLVLSPRGGFSKSPVLNRESPSAVLPGKTTRVSFFGEGLEGATALWTSFPASTVIDTNSNESDKVSIRFTLSKKVPAGIGAVRLATTNGISDLRLLMIDDLAGIAGSDTNKSPATAQELKIPGSVDGHTDALGFDYFRFTGRKGRRVSIEVVANRLGSPLDPVVRLLDARGRELVYCDDDPSLAADCRLAYKIPATGEYLIELRDVSYQGGVQYRYRLRVGNFPLVSSPFPLEVRRGDRTKVMFIGPSVEGVRPRRIHVPDNATCLPLSVKFSRGQGSGFVMLTTGPLRELMEIEPNDEPKSSTRMTVPSAINGRFMKPKDRDYYEFAAARDQRLVFTGRTRSLGSPCDLVLRLFKSDGTQIAAANVEGANEGTITNTFKEAGTYRLLVEELNHGGAPDFAYRVEVEKFQPGFVLNVETDKVEAESGGKFKLKVTAGRRGYDGPIALSLDGLGDDLALENDVISGTKNETTLEVKLPTRLVPGQLFGFKISGKAKIGDGVFQAPASTMAALQKLFPLLRYPPLELDGLVALGVVASPREKALPE